MVSFNDQLALRQQVEASGMPTVKLNMPKSKALELFQAYKKHKAYQTPEDYEVMRTYQLIAQGNVVIQALESVKRAGPDETGFPRLALMRASRKECYVEVTPNGSVTFSHKRWQDWQNKRNTIRLPVNTMPLRNDRLNASALLPTIPLHLRPKRGLDNYHILWEAEWKKLPPGDPYLLRQIGKGDMWLVVAAWDLTDVEKAAMRTRINAA